MAVVTTVDIIEDARWREENGLVSEIVRVAIVSGLEAFIAPSNPRDHIFKLLMDPNAGPIVAPDLPLAGSSHPWETALKLRVREPTALGHGIARVMLVYRRDDVSPPVGQNYTTRGSSRSEQIETQLDRAGNQIVLTHPGKPDQGGEIHPFETRSEIQAYWLEQSQFPGDLTRNFTNKLNDGPWVLDTGAVARTWHCVDISWEPEDMGRTPPLYRFTASFSFNPDGFDPQVVYIDPETGRPPPGLVEGQGYKTIEWYEEADFDLILP